jgi:hypothetical protein
MSLALALLLPLALASKTPIDFDPGPGWDEVSREGDELVVYRKSVEGSPVLAYQGVAIIDAPISKVIGVIRDIDRRPEWANRIAEARVLKTHSDHERTEYVRTEVPWPFQDRDFVYRAGIRFDPTAKSVTVDIRSVEDPATPPRDGLVRGLIHDGSFTATAIDSGKRTKIVAKAHAEPRGNIPTWIVNLVQKTFPKKTIQGLSRQVSKDDVKVDPETEALYH